MDDLTSDQLKFLKDCEGGADVWGYRDAQVGRELEALGLVIITSAMADVPGEKQQPYFGAITNKSGRKILKGISSALKSLKGEP